MTWRDGGRELVFSGQLPLEHGAAFEQAIRDLAKTQRAADKKSGTVLEWQQSTADALVTLARQSGDDSDGVRRSPTTLIVHLSDDEPPMLEGAGPISPETAARLACDARRLTLKLQDRDLVHSRVGRCASYPQLRALHKRTGGHCQYPGCTATRELEAHHLTAVEHGGATDLANLILLCSRHHKHAPRPRHPHQRHRRATRLHGSIRTRHHHQPATRTTALRAPRGDAGYPLVRAEAGVRPVVRRGHHVTELDLTRSPEDRRRYDLRGVGALRLEGTFSRSATAEAATGTWRLARQGLWQRHVVATDQAGVVEGEFAPRDIRRGGALRWGDRELTLHPVSALRERYALAENGRELARIDGRSWGRRPVTVTLPERDAVEPGLLLFACFVVRHLARNADSSSAGSAAAAAG